MLDLRWSEKLKYWFSDNKAVGLKEIYCTVLYHFNPSIPEPTGDYSIHSRDELPVM
jgi:hypothetical protein